MQLCEWIRSAQWVRVVQNSQCAICTYRNNSIKNYHDTQHLWSIAKICIPCICCLQLNIQNIYIKNRANTKSNQTFALKANCRYCRFTTNYEHRNHFLWVCPRERVCMCVDAICNHVLSIWTVMQWVLNVERDKQYNILLNWILRENLHTSIDDDEFIANHKWPEYHSINACVRISITFSTKKFVRLDEQKSMSKT